ncbi:MAG: hypothetical protein OEV40_05740 [Acidimicrobiia bacterium]|nr:hypothetical protein [Acidimicrobiia bacterium]
MRRGLASLIMGVSLLVATAAWSGFVLSRTVLDPGRSERLAEVLLDNPDVRSAIVDRLADSVEAQIPADVPVARETIEDGATAALDDPRVEALIVDGLVRAHQNALAGIDEPVTLDAGALGAAGRQAVVERQPELDLVLPAAPSVEVELPNTGLAWLGTLKRYVDRLTLLGAFVALVGVTTAFVLARNRAAALRRIAFWAFGAAAFWLAVAYALPWLLQRVAPSSVSIATAAVDVFFGAMILPALALAAIGLGVLLLSLAWPAVERRRPAATLDRVPAPQAISSTRPLVVAPASIAGQPRYLTDRPVPPQPPPNFGYARSVPEQEAPTFAAAPVESWRDPRLQDPYRHDRYGERPYQQHPGYAAEIQPTERANDLDRSQEPATRRYGPPDQDATAEFPEITSQAAPPASPPLPVSPPIQPTPAPETVVRGIEPRPVEEPHGRDDEPATPRIDPDVAAEADDFGAEWVEGVGYVDEPPRH